VAKAPPFLQTRVRVADVGTLGSASTGVQTRPQRHYVGDPCQVDLALSLW
jgi:hypothetical protein